MQIKRFKYRLYFGLALALIVAFVCWGPRSRPAKPLATADLGDGRILQVEGVTYGTYHQIGSARSALIGRFRRWLPKGLANWLEPKYPHSTITTDSDKPALVVWVNAVDAETGTNVDCQGIRVEMVDDHGDRFGADTSSWFGGERFWRVGHMFHAFPRTERKLTMVVTTWKDGHTNRVEFLNPYEGQPAAWRGAALPCEKRVGDLNIVLSELNLRTNGGAETAYWETRSVYWEPVWELRRDGRKMGGWEAPEWMAEDPTGNKSQHLGVHQPVLRFSATFYPSATNTNASQVIAILPNAILTSPQSTLPWNQKVPFGTNEMMVYGLFPPGNRVFSEGILITNTTAGMRAVRGGAPTGWTGSSVTVNPLTVKNYHGHYSLTNSVIYLRAPVLNGKEKLALRLRDEQGTYWVAKLDTQGTPDGVHAFIIDLPAETKSVTPEVVLLKPVEAEFTAKAPEGQR